MNRRRSEAFSTNSSIDRMESDIEYIKRDISDLKGDVKDIRKDMGEIRKDMGDIRKDMEKDFRISIRALIAATLGLAGLMAKGFGWI
ncbi:TPA: hypothetical protein KEY88_000222 [Serratia marcescens]|nr:hypothetical protein [Serratia marcescens]